MKYDDFVAICKGLSKKFTGDGVFQTNYYVNTPCGVGPRKEVLSPRLYVDWETGGMTGGSCWMEADEELESYTTHTPPKNLEILDAVLKSVCPTMVPAEYDSLKNELVHEDSYSESADYYGNYSEYATKEVDLQKLFDYLKEKGFI